MHMTENSTSRLDQVLTGVALTEFLTNTVLRICSRSQDTVNKISSYQLSCDIACDPQHNNCKKKATLRTVCIKSNRLDFFKPEIQEECDV